MRIVVYTLGCKVNQYESESMMSMLERMGHTVFSHLEFADVYIINTCAVTNEAEKNKSKLRDELLKYDQKVIVLKDANQMG